MNAAVKMRYLGFDDAVVTVGGADGGFTVNCLTDGIDDAARLPRSCAAVQAEIRRGRSVPVISAKDSHKVGDFNSGH